MLISSTDYSTDNHKRKRKPNLKLTIKNVFFSPASSPKSSSSLKHNVSLIMNTCGLIEKENLYLTTKKEYRHVTQLNRLYTSYLTEMKKLTAAWYTNQKKADEMLSKLKSKFREYSVIVDDYDKQLKLFNYEKVNIVQSHEGVLRDRKELQTKINKQLEEVTAKTDKQNKTIETLLTKIKQLKVFKEKECKRLEQCERSDRLRVEKLRREYDILKLKLQKYSEETNYEHKNTLMLHDENLSQVMITRENKDIQLREGKMRNEMLNAKYHAMYMKVCETQTKRRKEVMSAHRYRK